MNERKKRTTRKTDKHERITSDADIDIITISSGGILPVLAINDYNRDNPANDDHRILASIFLPFSEVFPSETTTFPRVPDRNPRNRGPESLS